MQHWPHEVDAADEVAKTPVQREEVVSGDVAMAECAGLDGLPPVLDESSPLSTYSAASQVCAFVCVCVCACARAVEHTVEVLVRARTRILSGLTAKGARSLPITDRV